MRNPSSSAARRVLAAVCRLFCAGVLWIGLSDRSWAGPALPGPVNLASLPMSFEPNVGQYDDDVSFFVRGAGCSIAVGPAEAKLLVSEKKTGKKTTAVSARSPRGHQTKIEAAPASRIVRLELIGANKSAAMKGEQPLPGIINYFLGNDPAVWKTGIPTYSRARFSKVYPGVDVIYYGNGSRLEYDFVVSPGADPHRIRLRFTGADEVTLDATGDLILQLGDRQMRWQRPVAYQQINGTRSEVSVAYRLSPSRHVEFELGEYDATRELVIDPLLIYNTYVGGNDIDSMQTMTVDGWGNTYLAGTTLSTNFPVFKAYRTNAYAYSDVFVTKLNSNATALVFSTYFGGGSNDWANAVAVDGSSNVYVTGYSDSLNLPMKNAYKNSVGDYGDAFLTKFGPLGTNLLYSTYFGDSGGSGADYEEGFAVAVNNTGGAWIAGATASGSAFNNVAPVQNGFGGGFQDAMAARFDTTSSGGGSLVWGTWLGGNYSDVAYGIAVDTNNNCYITGTMLAEFDDFGVILPANFPIINAYQPTYGGGFNDAFLVKINSASNPSRVFATYLGGASEDSAYGVTVDALSQAHVVGETSSGDFPIVNGQQASEMDGGFFSDAFLTKFNAAGSALLYSTFFGGTRSEGARTVRVDRFGHVYVAGYSQSADLPVTPDAVCSALGGATGIDTDLFLAKFNPVVPGPSGLIFATYYGGSAEEAFGGDFDIWSLFAPANLGVGLGVDSSFNMYLGSDTASTNLPSAGGATYGPNAKGGGDVFVAKIASPVDVSVGMLASASSVIVGSNITYSIYANNNGLSTFTNVLVTDLLPSKLQFLSATNSPGVVSNSGNNVFLAFGNLTNAAARVATIVAKAIEPGTTTNDVALTSTTSDANTNNNQSSLITTIRGVANLVLSTTATPNPITATSNITYVLTVTNLGPWPASSIVLTNLVPAGATYVSSVSSQGPTAVAAGLVYAFIGDLASNAVARVTNVFQVGLTTGTLLNYAGVYQYELDPVPANNDSVAAITVNGLNDMIIGRSTNEFSGSALYVTSNLTYRVFLTNKGPTTASSVFVTNAVPFGATYVSATASQGTFTQYLGTVTFNLGTLTSNQTANVSVTAKPGFIGLITNSSVVTSAGIDLVLSNNTSSAVSTVAPVADLALSMTAPAGQVVVTSNAVFSITVSNRGPTFSTNITVVNPIPANSFFVSATSSQGSPVFDGSTVTTALGQINSNGFATVTVTLRPWIEGPFINSASVSAGVFDPVSANNTASATATVTNHPGGPILRISRVGNTSSVVLNWTTNSPGYYLESTTNLVSGLGWVSNTSLRVVKGAQYQVTNSTVPSVRHYRLNLPPPPPPTNSFYSDGFNTAE